MPLPRKSIQETPYERTLGKRAANRDSSADSMKQADAHPFPRKYKTHRNTASILLNAFSALANGQETGNQEIYHRPTDLFRLDRRVAIAAGKHRTRRTPAAATAEHACPAPSEATTRIPARLGGATAPVLDGPPRLPRLHTTEMTNGPIGFIVWERSARRFRFFLGKTHKRSSGTQRVGTRCFRQENRSAVPSLKNRNHPCRRLFRQG